MDGRCQGCGTDLGREVETSELCLECQIDWLKEDLRAAAWERPLPDDEWFEEGRAELARLRELRWREIQAEKEKAR